MISDGLMSDLILILILTLLTLIILIHGASEILILHV